MTAQKQGRSDVFIIHQTERHEWINTLCRNLEGRGYRPTVGPVHRGRDAGLIPDISKAVLVVTPEAVESGWVRRQFERLSGRSQRRVDFRFIPLLVGDFYERPFVDEVECIDFGDSSRIVYLEAFYALDCWLADRPCDPDGPTYGDIEIPPKVTLPDTASPRTFASGGAQLLYEVARTMEPVLMLLAPVYRFERNVMREIKLGIRGRHVLHIMPPYSPGTDTVEYFQRLGEQCEFGYTPKATDWRDALENRLDRGERIFLLVSSFEHGSEVTRRELATLLRSVTDRYDNQLRVVLSGGERLAELKYGEGKHSLLNNAEVLIWPEFTAADVLAWQQREFPARILAHSEALEIMQVCGGHPRLVRHCLREREQGISTTDGYREALRRWDFVWQLFSPYWDDEKTRRQICSWLAKDDLGRAVPWPADRLLRRLYWSNLLVESDGWFKWRCELLREVGREVLECGS